MTRDLDALLQGLSREQKAALTAGADLWRSTAVPEAGIPHLKVTDGPIGARGDLTSGATSTCFPCGAALGATWDVELAERVGAALAQETKAKGAHVLLGPTVNLHRHPLAGRNFECYAEDPELSARIAVAWIRGLQAGGVGASIKHYVANDQEHERMTISSQVDERTLRELYLRPFEAAVAEADPWVVMAAYNRINGVYATEHRELLIDILKREWGWPGVVVSDWFATHDTVRAATGGTDLEMPGPPAQLGPRLADAVAGGDVADDALDEMARRMLHLLDRAGRFEHPDEEPERSDETDERRALARQVASSAIVLLRNDGTLPLDAGALRSLAVIGPAAHPGFDQGGGSAMVLSHRKVSPLDGVRAALPGVEITHARGCAPGALAPPIRPDLLGAGWTATVWTNAEGEGEPVHEGTWPEARYAFFGGRKLRGVERPAPLRIELRATLTPDQSGPWTFHLACAGRTSVRIDGDEQLLHDEDGPLFSVLPTGLPRYEKAVDLEAGRPVVIDITLTATSRRCFPNLAFGATPPDPRGEVQAAAALAGAADAAVVFVGTGPEVETEGIDRLDMAMPSDQDALVEAVLAAQPNTVVVVSAGAPLLLPWIDRAPATLWGWFGGQEAGHAIADVLLGTSDPGGRLPTTIPRALADTAAFATYPGENGTVQYDEGLLIGHRWHDAHGIAPLFPLGHGGSYALCDWGTPNAVVDGDGSVRVTVPVTNPTARAGVDVVQIYVQAAAGDAAAPPQQLAGFVKVAVPAQATVDATILVRPRALARWDIATGAWLVPGGERTLVVARSAGAPVHRVVVSVGERRLATPQP